jgi:2-oxoglutarate dehydrogenase E2 component (dihydrolipoamide succinyltransferase)
MEPAPKAAPPARPPQEVRASPLVRRLAREHGIDLTDLGGTGLGGRITKQDVLSHLDQRAAPAGVPEEAAPAPAAGPLHAPSRPAAPAPEPLPAPPQPAPAAAGGPEGEVTPMSTMRRAIAEHMVASRRTSAHVTTVFEVDMSAIVGLRERMKAPFDEREGIKLTLTPFLARGLIQTAREFPILNASVSGDSIVTRRAVHLGVAVALEGGLIVPVVRDAHLRSFTGLALAIHDLAERARTKKLKPDEVTGGTITITNPGVFGGLFATPIINQPQVAILGVGGLEKRPVVVNDAIAIRPMMYLALSFDHRVIDGAVADQAMARLKAILTSWSEWID